MNNNVLVKINTAESDYVRITTYQRGGIGGTFYVAKAKFRELFAAPEGKSVLDRDCGSWLAMYSVGGVVNMEFAWIRGGQARTQNIQLDQADMEALVYGRFIVRRLSKEPIRQAEITLRESAHELIAKLNSQERRALSKALRDSFKWPGDHVRLSRDWGKDFWFSAENIHGGLCRHEYNGKITYSVHT